MAIQSYGFDEVCHPQNINMSFSANKQPMWGHQETLDINDVEVSAYGYTRQKSLAPLHLQEDSNYQDLHRNMDALQGSGFTPPETDRLSMYMYIPAWLNLLNGGL